MREPVDSVLAADRAQAVRLVGRFVVDILIADRHAGVASPSTPGANGQKLLACGRDVNRWPDGANLPMCWPKSAAKPSLKSGFNATILQTRTKWLQSELTESQG
ncbi:hypothetical protein HB777_11910 [Mesorhizobium loti]|nr:hypothetical protein HB777_11910 [Mesorhizobium loti]